MSHIFQELLLFIAAVFAHWQIWLSGGGIGGFIVIAIGAIEKLLDRSLTKKQYVYLFLISFFLCACFLAWVDKDEESRAIASAKSVEHDADLSLVKKTQNDYGNLQYSCNYQSGVVDTLRKQSGDQQGTINNCQTQAIKLLQPMPFQWHAMALEEAEVLGATRKQRWILLTNKEVSPAQFVFNCSRPIDRAEVKIVGSVA